jgi:hypothetical protein
MFRLSSSPFILTFRRVMFEALGAALALAVSVAGTALADPYDFRLSKFGNPQSTPSADADFRAFARQFAAGMTSANLAPPETLGHSGFAVSADLSVVNFKGALPTNVDFVGPLLVPSLHFRKGLPASFELGGRAGWISQSRMGMGTLELKWALNEGFKYLPDIGVRGSITKLVNAKDFDLTAGGLDIGVGKQFALGGMVTLTPYVGWNLMFVGASTGNIDFNPGRTLAASDGQSSQFNDFYIFTALSAAANTHNRFYGGFRFIGGVFQLGFEVSYSILGTNSSGANIDVLAWNFTLAGLDF